MVKIFDENFNLIRSETLHKHNVHTVAYVITDEYEDERALEKWAMLYANDSHRMNSLAITIHNSHVFNIDIGRGTYTPTLIDNVVYNSLLTTPHVWMYSPITEDWVLMNEIIDLSAALNARIKSNSKTKFENENENQD